MSVLDLIDELGERLCCYMGPLWPNRTCDCKYGTARITGQMGEHTGCPELRDIRDLVERMLPDAEA